MAKKHISIDVDFGNDGIYRFFRFDHLRRPDRRDLQECEIYNFEDAVVYFHTPLPRPEATKLLNAYIRLRNNGSLRNYRLD